MKRKAILVCLLALGGKMFSQHNTHHPNPNNSCAPVQENGSRTVFVEQQVTTAYDSYLNLQEALVRSDSDQAQKAAVELESALKQVEGGKTVYTAALKVASATSLVEQRKAFTDLSKEMLGLVKSSALKSGQIYVGYCPMANANTGGSWLTTSNEILNPYFGDKMLKCGSIKETIQ